MYDFAGPGFNNVQPALTSTRDNMVTKGSEYRNTRGLLRVLGRLLFTNRFSVHVGALGR